MAGIIADHNIEGHFVVLLRIWTSSVWVSLWENLELEVECFDRLGIPYDTSDRDLWQVCQQRSSVLITANRNDEGSDSLESTIRDLNEASSLPVLTIADPELILASQDYAERVAIQVLEYLMDLDNDVPILTVEKVRFTGEMVAAMAAESPEQAEEAATLVEGLVFHAFQSLFPVL